MRPLAMIALSALCVTHLAARAAADTADENFQRGREALGAGKYADACRAFDASYRARPTLEARFNIALCSEQTGKLATALAIHQELAVTEITASRRARSATRIDELTARVARLRLDIRARSGAMPADLEVTLDGVPITNPRDLPIDLGSHAIVATAPGVNWTGEVTATREKQRVTVRIDLGNPAAPIQPLAPTREPPEPAPDEPGSPSRRTLGLGLTVTGGALLVGGLVVGAFARSAWHDADARCPDRTCESPMDKAIGDALVDTARRRGNVATALVVGGVVLGTSGLVLWLTAPKRAVPAERIGLRPTWSTSSGGLALFGKF